MKTANLTSIKDVWPHILDRVGFGCRVRIRIHVWNEVGSITFDQVREHLLAHGREELK